MSNPYLPLSPSSSSTSFAPYPSYPSNSRNSNNNNSNNNNDSQPITRSRTLFYLSIRDSSTTSYPTSRRASKRAHRQYGDTVDVSTGEEEEEGLIGREGNWGVDMKGLPPKWVDVSDEVEEILSRVKLKVSTLDKLHAKHVLPGFTDRSAEEREIERQTTDITRDFRRCTNLISSVQPGPRAPRVEVVTAKNVQRGLAQKVQELSGQFRKKQRVYMQKLQGHAIKNKDLMVASGAMTLKGSDVLDELQEDEQASKTQLQSQSLAQATVAVDIDIQQRTNEITQIASSISELADLFRDLGNMIVEQGTVLDSVEYNVQQTARELTGAVEELKVAQKYQANTGRRKCILFLVLLIVGLIIVLVYKPRGGDTSPTTSTPPYSSLAAISSSTTDTLTSGITTIPTPKPSRRPHRPLPKPSPLDTTAGIF
ncbi:hypothetical protein CI109_104936 [Kwoniella shandongensis]|uniref:Uncharacterized protein n=1 Tax=Kwoniella shandongensis TaxID=1734106 RepID=A0A5M6BTL9_9TREE|nr:uncharacterized protein CI109_006271 [Kwoniella shandongensis]KAA5525372.1 hypothetical protein CI109_006271 [Kwoniella shandongensis]